MTPLSRGIISSGKLGVVVPPPLNPTGNMLDLNTPSSSDITFANSASDIVKGSNDWTISLIYTHSTESTYQYIYNKYSGGSDWVQIRPVGSNIVIVSSTAPQTSIPIGSTLINGTTYQLIIRKSGSTHDVFLDGTKGTSVTQSAAYTTSSMTLEIANSTNDSGDRIGKFSLSNYILFDEAITLGDVSELQTKRLLGDYSSDLKAKMVVAIPFNNVSIDPVKDIITETSAVVFGAATYSGEELTFELP